MYIYILQRNMYMYIDTYTRRDYTKNTRNGRNSAFFRVLVRSFSNEKSFLIHVGFYWVFYESL